MNEINIKSWRLRLKPLSIIHACKNPIVGGVDYRYLDGERLICNECEERLPEQLILLYKIMRSGGQQT